KSCAESRTSGVSAGARRTFPPEKSSSPSRRLLSKPKPGMDWIGSKCAGPHYSFACFELEFDHSRDTSITSVPSKRGAAPGGMLAWRKLLRKGPPSFRCCLSLTWSPALRKRSTRRSHLGRATASQFYASTTRQVELRDRQFVQPASCCVNTTAYISPS